MSFIEVKASSGWIKFEYTISTPKSPQADAIDPKLPVLLWFHALAFPYVFHSQFADPLIRKFNLVTFSFRTHGKTQGEDLPEGYGIKEAAEDVLALMDALQLPACHFVAMDYGSPVALEIAIAIPSRVSSLFIVSHTCLEEDVREGHQQLYEAWCASFPSPTELDMDRMVESGYGFAQFMFSNQTSDLGKVMSDVAFPFAQKNWGYYGQRNYRIGFLQFILNRKAPTLQDLSKIKCSMKLVYGTDDAAYPQKYTEDFLAELCKAGIDASMFIVVGAPHFVGVDFADKLNPILHDFILRNESRQVPSLLEPVSSPWDGILRAAGWDPDGPSIDSDEDDFVITYPPRK